MMMYPKRWHLYCSTVSVAAVALLFASIRPALGEEEIVELWDPSVPFPETLEDIPPLPYGTYTYVQRGGAGTTQYLHEAGLAWFKGTLYAGWASARRDESAEDKMIRGRYSEDDGRTWSEDLVIAPEVEGRERREYAAFAESDGKLWMFTTRIHSGWSFADPKLEAFVLGEDGSSWEELGVVAEDDFVATDKPRQLDNGRWIFAGMAMLPEAGRHVGRNRIAISEPNDLTRWTVSGIEHPEGMRFPFVSFLVEGSDITAIMRNSRDTFALVSYSSDYGKTWTYARKTNVPMTGVKPFAGILSTGQRYLIACTPPERGDHSRRALTILVSDPDEKQFSKIWKISRGEPYPMRFEGRGKGPGPSQWSYPKAVEHDGKLYVIYTVNKEDAEMAIIPIGVFN